MTIASRNQAVQPGAWIPSASLATSVAQIAIASLAIAAGARVEIMLPFTPVPITGQTLVVAMTGMALGPRRGTLAVGAYLLEGALGLPVFSGGGSGPAHFVGPTGGYLMGFLASAASAGWLAERGWDRTPTKAASAMLLSSIWVFLLGAGFLAFHVGGSSRAVQLGVLPFLPGDLIKTMCAACLLPFARRCFRLRPTQ